MDNLLAYRQFTDRLVPISELRRYAGEYLDRLPQAKMYIITRSGRPFARLAFLDADSVVSNSKGKLVNFFRAAGGLHLKKHLSPLQINKILDKNYE